MLLLFRFTKIKERKFTKIKENIIKNQGKCFVNFSEISEPEQGTFPFP